MGNTDSKLHFRKAVIQLTTKTQPVEATDDSFWDQFWAETSTSIHDVFALVPAAEIRAVREESPSNLATLCYKAVERLVQGADSGCPSDKERQVVLNCTRLLTRILPHIFEDADWRGFFWSTVPGAGRARHLDEDEDAEARPLAESLLLAVTDLLFCPDFTVQRDKRSSQDTVEDVHSIDSCEYIWESGVGFAQSPPLSYIHDLNRTELLKLLLTCFSEAMYLPPFTDAKNLNPWVSFFCSMENRHALPLFTSLINVVCAYDPVGYGFPYNHLLFSDHREQLVEQAVQILIVTLEHEGGSAAGTAVQVEVEQESAGPDNLFVNYLSRIHREEDLSFILKGLARLLNNPLLQTYLPRSTKKIQFHQELLILFWKFCDFNKKFLFFVLKSSNVLDVLVPVLFYLNDARADQSRVGLMHIGVFVLLLLSGERNFGVRLNKAYTLRVPMDIPVFSGNHADLLIVIFHKIITSGHQRLQPLFDCLLTVIVNISPSSTTSSSISLTETTTWFTPSSVRGTFHQLANLPSDRTSIQKALQKTRKSKMSRCSSTENESMPGSRPAEPAEPGKLKTSLEATPGIDTITEKTQVSENGLLVVVPHSATVDVGAVGGANDTESNSERDHEVCLTDSESCRSRMSSVSSPAATCSATSNWVTSWKAKLPLQTIMRLLQVLVPQVEKICIDKGLTDESEILKFLQHGTLVGLLPIPHPILIRKYQANAGTAVWFRTYMWGVIYLRNVDPPIWYDTDIRLFEIQRI
ncbi:hypothetical protein JOB18_025180 [Solea senegalensis]|uniref:HID1 domain containing b n=1 Tax=Solea senegalensis TaxID=28829 RepID=A0AAV6RRH2_SOLSE|nr:hypothetical protein JOB18_025180 [Solea senegalensis]